MNLVFGTLLSLWVYRCGIMRVDLLCCSSLYRLLAFISLFQNLSRLCCSYVYDSFPVLYIFERHSFCVGLIVWNSFFYSNSTMYWMMLMSVFLLPLSTCTPCTWPWKTCLFSIAWWVVRRRASFTFSNILELFVTSLHTLFFNFLFECQTTLLFY